MTYDPDLQVWYRLYVCVVVNGRHQKTSSAQFYDSIITPKWPDILTFGHPSPSDTHFTVAVYVQPQDSDLDGQKEDVLLFSAGTTFPLMVLLTYLLIAFPEANSLLLCRAPLGTDL